MKKITKVQAAYIAGFLEGEGCFTINPQSSRPLSGNRVNLIPRILTSQKDLTPLTYLLQSTKVGSICYRLKNGSPKSSIYTHQIKGRQSLMDFIRAIFPYLKSPRTKKRAWCVYQMAKLRDSKGRKIVTDKNYKSRMKIYKIWKTTQRPRRIKGKVK